MEIEFSFSICAIKKTLQKEIRISTEVANKWYLQKGAKILKKYEILSFVTIKIYLEGIRLSEISQIEKQKCHMISLISVI